jgi:hypothetical protein
MTSWAIPQPVKGRGSLGTFPPQILPRFYGAVPPIKKEPVRLNHVCYETYIQTLVYCSNIYIRQAPDHGHSAEASFRLRSFLISGLSDVDRSIPSISFL